MSLELWFIPRASTWLLTSLGSLVMNRVLKRMPSSSPGGQVGQHGLHQLGGPSVAEFPTMDELEAHVCWLGGEEPQEPGLQIHVGAVQLVDGTVPHGFAQSPPLLGECWEDQVKAQPGVGHIVPVEGGLRQCEPGVRILGPEWRQLHLGWRQVLLSGHRSPCGRRRKPRSSWELLLLGHVGPA